MAYTLQDSYTTGYDQDSTFYAAYWYGQTFTANSAYSISRVSLPLKRVGSPGTLTVSIRATTAGLPTGADLCSATMDPAGIATSYAWHDFDFSPAAALSSGTVYAIVLRTATGDSSNLIGIQADNSSPAYAGGAFIYSLNSGASWTALGTRDLLFETYSGSDAAFIELTATGAMTSGGSAALTYFEVVTLAATGAITSSGTADLSYIITMHGDYTSKHETTHLVVAGSNSIWVED